MKKKTVYIYEGELLNRQQKRGFESNTSRLQLKSKLRHKGYFKVKIEAIPSSLLNRPLANKHLLQIINTLLMMLKSGLTLIEALRLQISENQSLVHKYVFLQLVESLHQGNDIKTSLDALDPLFPDFFKTVIGISETSGKLIDGLESLLDFYTNKENHIREIRKITRYPKVVAAASVLLIVGVIVFIIPMFSGIYTLFGDNLPLVTKILYGLSQLIHMHVLQALAVGFAILTWFLVPGINTSNPVLALGRLIKRKTQTRDDPYLYSQAMRMLLENGQPLAEASRHAAFCLSPGNARFGLRITELLDSGLNLTASFQKIGWFPAVYHTILSSAEQSGYLATGFAQISCLLEQKKEEEFNRWNKLIEPVMMTLLGGLILMILLAVYLPIFDLGNQLG